MIGWLKAIELWKALSDEQITQLKDEHQKNSLNNNKPFIEECLS